MDLSDKLEINTEMSPEKKGGDELESQAEGLGSVVEGINNRVKSDIGEVDKSAERIAAILDGNQSEVSQEIKDESKSNVDEANQDAIEIEEEIDIIIQQELIKTQEEVEKEREERREEWNEKKDPEKKSIIEKNKTEIEEYLKEKLTLENQNILGDKNVLEILRNYEDIRNLRAGLKDEIDRTMENRKEISENLMSHFSLENVDLSQLTGAEKGNVKKAADGFMKTTKNVLSIRKIDYLMETMEPNGDDFGNLKNTHEDRQIEMEQLQYIIKAIEEYQKYLEKFEALNEKSREEQRQEVVAAVENLEHISRTDKKLIATLVALGVVGGVVSLCLATGVPLPAFLTFDNITIAAGVAAAVGTMIDLQKQGELIPLIKKTAKVAGLAVALPIIGGGICLDWILNGEKTGKAIDFICGVGLPSWAQDSKKS
ncbi:hypothetical protein K0B03_02740 [Patescibacteria group bacterium]|nr:hypothetical protein [Patescibacteria group bacterium]